MGYLTGIRIFVSLLIVLQGNTKISIRKIRILCPIDLSGEPFHCSERLKLFSLGKLTNILPPQVSPDPVPFLFRLQFRKGIDSPNCRRPKVCFTVLYLYLLVFPHMLYHSWEYLREHGSCIFPRVS